MEAGELIADRYRVERELGRGGMGAVYLALDTQSSKQRRVAVKVAAAAGIAHEQFLARFEREAKIGCALGQEAGFVRAFDWGELDASRVYMAMDLVEGARSLDLRTGSLDERLSRLEEAAALVERAHDLGVIHRDLKPQNVLVAGDGRAWLADFGLAKLRGEAATEVDAPVLTQTGHGMGTPQFMPPEQFEDARGADERADVYALGVMLFLALTGKYPFDGRSAAEVMTRQMKAQLGQERAPRARDHDPAVRVGLDSLCAEATALDRTKRTQSVSIFLRELRRARGKLGKPSARTPAVSVAPSPETAPTEVGVEPSLPSIRTLPDLGPAPGATPAPAPVAAAAAYEPPVLRGLDSMGAGSILGDVLGNATGRILATLAVIVFVLVVRFAVFAARSHSSYEGGPVQERLDRETRAMQEATYDPPPPAGRAYPGEDADTKAARLEAERGDARAMLNLAIRLERGTGVQASMPEAVRWYRRAANEDADAMVCLGDLLAEGQGVAKNPSEARRYFERAKAMGNSDAAQRIDALDAEREAQRPRHR